MHNELIVMVKIPFLYLSFDCSISKDMTLEDNISLLKVLIIKHLDNSYPCFHQPLVIDEKTGVIFEQDLTPCQLNMYEGMTLLLY